MLGMTDTSPHIVTDVERLLDVFDAYVAHTGLSEARVSTLVFSAGHRILSLREGREIGSRRIWAAISWFSANWPADLDWPSDIPRPQPGSPVFAHGNGNAAVAASDAGEAA